MNKSVVLAISLSIVSLFLSSINVYWFLTQQSQSIEPEVHNFSVNVIDGGAAFRTYIQVNNRIIIADEDVGIELYPFSASVGSTIKIKVIDENRQGAFTVEFSHESPYSLIQRVTNVSPITIEYTVVP